MGVQKQVPPFFFCRKGVVMSIFLCGRFNSATHLLSQPFVTSAWSQLAGNSYTLVLYRSLNSMPVTVVIRKKSRSPE